MRKLRVLQLKNRFEPTWLIFAIGLFSLSSCAFNYGALPFKKPDCKIRTYTNHGIVDYLKHRKKTLSSVRMAILPFDVQETFAPTGNESLNFGRELARKVQSELIRQGEISIVEVFNIDRWPGKREDFFTGNYGAIEVARQAGYDLLLVGYLDKIRNLNELGIFTKLIDLSKGVTLWYAKNSVLSHHSSHERALADLRLVQQRPEMLYLNEKGEYLSSCVVEQLFTADPHPE